MIFPFDCECSISLLFGCESNPEHLFARNGCFGGFHFCRSLDTLQAHEVVESGHVNVFKHRNVQVLSEGGATVLVWVHGVVQCG